MVTCGCVSAMRTSPRTLQDPRKHKAGRPSDYNSTHPLGTPLALTLVAQGSTQARSA